MTTLLNILLLVAVALSITGVVNRTRARLAGPRGPRRYGRHGRHVLRDTAKQPR